MPVATVLVSLHSLSAPGYLIQVDDVFGPHAPAIAWGFSAPIELIDNLLGGAVAGRLWVAGALFLCGFGPMVFLRDRHWTAQVFAGILAALNPWVFGRLVEGQWGVAAAVGVAFLWLGPWEDLLRRPRAGAALKSAGLAWAAVTFDQHSIVILIALAVASWLGRAGWRNGSSLAWGVASFAVVGLVLTYGWVPFFLGHNLASYATVRGFTTADLSLFRATGSPVYGLWMNLLGLFGFWPERLGRIPLLNQGAPWWPVTTLFLTAAAVTGAYLRRDRAWLLPLGVLGVLAAGSTATGPGLAVASWAMRTVPLLGAFREPEKWAALWLIALVVLGAETLTVLAHHALGPGSRRSALAGVGLACVCLSAVVPSGVRALREYPVTVQPVTYPATWLRTARFIRDHVASSSEIVILPWQLYEPLAFAGRRLTENPARAVFPGTLLSPTDAQVGGSQTATGPQGIGYASLNARPGSCALSRSLSRLNASWALVEPTLHGAADQRELVACGWHVAFKRPGGPAVLQR
ncbi:MAG: hypothetical protein ACREN1_05300 [Candidatus Dormibacteria bacterium]